MQDDNRDPVSTSPSRKLGIKKLGKRDAAERRHRPRTEGKPEVSHTEWLRNAPPVFLKACELAGVAPSYRQASKWRRDQGAARKHMHEAIRLLEESASHE